MEYTDEQKRAFKDEFAGRRKKQLIVVLPLFVLIILIVVLGDTVEKEGIAGLPPEALVGFFGVYVLVALVFSLKNWRCPACNSYLGKNTGPDFCPRCGVALK